MSIEEDAYKYAIKNAALHEGKADTGAIIGKLKALYQDLPVKKTMEIALEAVKKVNTMRLEEIKKEFARFDKEGYELKPREKDDPIPELEWAEKEPVVTRYAPNPNGPFHLGNARTAFLSKEFAKRYNGKFILRFDDTDPKVKKPIKNAEQVFKEDLKWLDCVPDETVFASDRLDIYHSYMKTALQEGFAYICQCYSEEWKEKTRKKQACPCRSLDPKEQLKKFEKMLSNEIKEGQAVLRIKTDLEHKDPSVRDWWAAKIVDNPKHPNHNSTGKHVWPSYNFASAIDEHLLKVTLIIRGQEHEQNKTKQEFLYKHFGWIYPHCFHIGRISLPGLMLSTSKIKEGIEKGLYSGWDDPRLGTIRAFRRRGFKPGILKEAVFDLGVNTNDSVLQWSKLIDLNKKAIEEESERMPFFEEPMQLTIDMTPNGPSKAIVDKKQFDKFKAGDVIRLRDLFNVKIKGKDPLETFSDFVGEAKINKPIAGWFEQGADVDIVMDDNTKKLGIASEKIMEKKLGSRVYFDKLGYCLLEGKETQKAFLRFTHK